MIPFRLRTVLRSPIYQAEKTSQRLRFRSMPTPKNGWPILLGLSFPKSGTHLLDQILLGFSNFAPFSLRLHSFFSEYEGGSGRERTLHETLSWFEGLRPCDVASAHLFAHPELVPRICSSDFISYFIFRDPRDVVVSHVYYVTDMEKTHVHHDYYRSLPNFDSRLRVSILGRPDAGVEFPDIADRFAPYLGWLDQPEVMKIHFEDLVNNRIQTLEMILDHFIQRIPIDIFKGVMLGKLESSINLKRSPTFRSGKSGEWRTHFKEEHKELFKRAAGELLIKLGYENDNTW